MLLFLFKVIRFFLFFLQKIQKQVWLYYIKVLYRKRLLIQQPFSSGRFFDLHFDASDSSIHIGKNVQFRDYCQIRSGMNGQLKIGDGVFFNIQCTITCFKSITIGNDCQFGEGVKFYDHNHRYNETDKLINEQGYTVGHIRIGNNCWFGSNVIILKDVEIGDNVVVGAGCIIHTSIPSNTVVINKQEQVFKSY